MRNQKLYKDKKINIFTSRNVRFMPPGDLRVARCFFSIFLGGFF